MMAEAVFRLRSIKGEFIDHIVRCGKDFHYGLEVGNEPELLAAMSYDLSEKALFIAMVLKIESLLEVDSSLKPWVRM